MIARILGEGQVELPEAALAELNVLDDELLAAVEAGDEARFTTSLAALLARVRELGTPLPDDALVPSELVLPSADAGLAEVAGLLGDDGLIPG